MRRVMVTPTFAAGLGVVIAAGLAYPMARTVFQYRTVPPCQQADCSMPDPGGSLAATSPAPLRSHTASPAPKASSANGGKTSPASGQPVLDYQTVSYMNRGFVATLTVVSASRAAGSKWRLSFSYPAATILRVWGGQLTELSKHTAVVQGGGGQSGWQGNHTISINITVTGRAQKPASARFDGVLCKIVVDPQPGSTH